MDSERIVHRHAKTGDERFVHPLLYKFIETCRYDLYEIWKVN